MLIDKRHVFWQALFVTVIVFLLGLVLGVYLEQARSDKLTVLSYESEVSFYDSLLISDIFESSSFSSNELIDLNLKFANDIYDKAKELEKFDNSNKITKSAKAIHKKYDFLRTALWLNTIRLKEDYAINSVVYFYIYDTEDIQTKAEQIAFSKVLEDLKEKRGNDLILIPIAVDSDIASLDYLLNIYKVDKFPSVLINERYLVTEISTVEDLERYLD
jgi:hypothetical protein